MVPSSGFRIGIILSEMFRLKNSLEEKQSYHKHSIYFNIMKWS